MRQWDNGTMGGAILALPVPLSYSYVPYVPYVLYVPCISPLPAVRRRGGDKILACRIVKVD